MRLEYERTCRMSYSNWQRFWPCGVHFFFALFYEKKTNVKWAIGKLQRNHLRNDGGVFSLQRPTFHFFCQLCSLSLSAKNTVTAPIFFYLSVSTACPDQPFLTKGSGIFFACVSSKNNITWNLIFFCRRSLTNLKTKTRSKSKSQRPKRLLRYSMHGTAGFVVSLASIITSVQKAASNHLNEWSNAFYLGN